MLHDNFIGVERNHGDGTPNSLSRVASNNKIRTVLREQSEEYADKAPRPWDNVHVRIEYSEHGGQLWMDMDDERFTWGQGVLLEIWEGELRVVVWADPESEEPTHTIPISQMSSEFRKEYERDIKDGGQENPVKPGGSGITTSPCPRSNQSVT